VKCVVCGVWLELWRLGAADLETKPRSFCDHAVAGAITPKTDTRRKHTGTGAAWVHRVCAKCARRVFDTDFHLRLNRNGGV
jgi:hypothetical protein